MEIISHSVFTQMYKSNNFYWNNNSVVTVHSQGLLRLMTERQSDHGKHNVVPNTSEGESKGVEKQWWLKNRKGKSTEILCLHNVTIHTPMKFLFIFISHPAHWKIKFWPTGTTSLKYATTTKKTDIVGEK